MQRNEALEVVSRNVTTAMERHGYGVRELARKSGNSAMIVSRLTRKENMPAGDVLARIAEALGVSIDDLFNPRFSPKKIPMTT